MNDKDMTIEEMRIVLIEATKRERRIAPRLFSEYQERQQIKEFTRMNDEAIKAWYNLFFQTIILTINI